MPSFGAKSKAHLAQLHPLLQKVLNEAIKTYDFAIIESFRDREAQEDAFRRKTTKAHFGQSAHNYKPAVAVDIVPHPLDWNDTAEFEKMGAHVMAVAKKLGVSLRWGGDWDFNPKTKDGWDKPHFELHPWRNYIKKA